MTTEGRLELVGVDGIAEVTTATDLADLVAGLHHSAMPQDGLQDGLHDGLRDGDIVLVTSKVVSKAEGRVVRGERERAIVDETVRVVARRGPTTIVENRLGLVMAAAGVDASNVEPGMLVLLPRDPDASAREIRERVHARTGRNVAVVVTDTAGRAWRTGQTDIAIGLAGLAATRSLAGQVDGYGNTLEVTEPAVADELAGAANLVQGKLAGRPVSVVRGLADSVLPVGEHGPGARALVRQRSMDMFALGSREAAVAAASGRDADCFGSPAPAVELVTALVSATYDARAAGSAIEVTLPGPDVRRSALAEARIEMIAFAHGWAPDRDPSGGPAERGSVRLVGLHPGTP